MPKPRDKALYERIKKKLYRDNPRHSAYRSATLVKLYKAAYAKKYKTGPNSKSKSGSNSKSRFGINDPYIGKKPKNTGIKRWLKEEWKNQRGEIGYKYKSDIYRPTKRITAKTPKTFKELKPTTIKRARKLKAKTGHAKFR
jgi:hypothetical protein